MLLGSVTGAVKLKPVLSGPIQQAIGDVVPSDHQAAFLTWVAEGRGNAILQAVAGSGKTFTLRLATKVIKSQTPDASVTVCVFARRNADEMKGTFPQGVYTGTQHGIAYGAYRRRYPNVRVDKDQRKVWEIIDAVIAGLAKGDEVRAKGIRDAYGSFVKKLVGFAKAEGVGYLVPDVPESWEKLIERNDLWLESETTTEEAAIRIAREVLRRNNEQTDLIDYDDMLYMTLVRNVSLYQSDWVFVDEAQDTNPVQRALLKRMVRPGGRLVAVGDERQGIFMFRGATADALKHIREEWSAVELPLTTSYRCCKAAAKVARRIVPYFQANEGNEEGEVSFPTDHLNQHGDLGTVRSVPIEPGHAVLCRNTAPLVELAYRLIGDGVGAKLMGRDIGEGLISVVKRMRAKGIDALEEKLSAWAEREIAKAVAKNQDSKAQSVEDKRDAIFAVIRHLPETARTVSGLIKRIESIFDDKENGSNIVRLSTIHRAKGLEWDTVHVVNAELLPSKYARQEAQLRQEANLAYVAVTRARKRLIINGEWNY